MAKSGDFNYEHMDMSRFSDLGREAAQQAFDLQHCAVVPLIDQERRAVILGDRRKRLLEVQGAAFVCVRQTVEAADLSLEISPPPAPARADRQFLELCIALGEPLLGGKFEFGDQQLSALRQAGTVIGAGVSYVSHIENPSIGYGLLHVPKAYKGVPEAAGLDPQVYSTELAASLFDFIAGRVLPALD